MNHATMPISEIERILSASEFRTSMSLVIAEAIERGRKYSREIMEYSQRSMAHPSELTLVLR